MTDLVTDKAATTEDGFKLAAARDLPDLRDQFYRPTLGTLRPEKEKDDRFFYKTRKGLRIAIRDQGQTPTCTGQALAALIDILRQQQAGTHKVEPVSASMLYQLATEYELGLSPDGGLLSLRSVIKAFYHYGVCADGLLKPPGMRTRRKTDKSDWPFIDKPAPRPENPGDPQPPMPPELLTVDRAKAARRIPLGAYYRVQPRLNDYHAALNEAGAVLASANIHTGWMTDTVRANGGEIRYQLDQPLGVHAFVIVGYNDEGFLVLNSWGSEWGGYRGYDGIGLWRYGDWADSIQDGGVVRLGVSTPGAFQYSIGEQGLSFSDDPIQSTGLRPSRGSTRCLELLGHFAHLDDGYHVTRGPYATSPASVNETVRYLGGIPGWPRVVEEKPDAKEMGKDTAPLATGRKRGEGYRGVLLWIGGSLEGMKDAVTLAVNRKDRIKAKQLYPYSVLWCSDFVDETTAVLAGMFADVAKRVGRPGPALDVSIETACRGVGRSFWRDIFHGAGEATQRDYEGAHILDSILSLDHLDIHLVVDGAGAVFLHYYLFFLMGHNLQDRALGNIRSVDFITPAIKVEFVTQYINWTNFLERFGPGTNKPRARLWTPSAEIEDRLGVDVYGKSILHLISNCFENRALDYDHMARRGEPLFDPRRDLSPTQRQRGLSGPPLLGMAPETSGLAEKGLAKKWPILDRLDLRTIPAPNTARDRLSHQQLVQSAALFNAILAEISGEADGAKP